MRARTARFWALLAGVVAVAVATAEGTRLALVAGGLLCVALALGVIALDGQRKRGRTRR